MHIVLKKKQATRKSAKIDLGYFWECSQKAKRKRPDYAVGDVFKLSEVLSENGIRF